MKQADLHSLVSISGAVRAVDPRCPENGDPDQRYNCRFAVENDDGRFSMQAMLPPEDCDRLQNSQVRVIGALRSSFFRKCRQHNQFIEAFYIVILSLAKQGRDKVLTVLPYKARNDRLLPLPVRLERRPAGAGLTG